MVEERLRKDKHPFFSQIVPTLFFQSKYPVEVRGEWVAGNRDFHATLPKGLDVCKGLDLSPKWTSPEQEGAPSPADLYECYKKIVSARSKAAVASNKTGEGRSTADVLEHNKNHLALALELWLSEVGRDEITTMVSEDCPGAFDGSAPPEFWESRTSTGRVKRAKKAADTMSFADRCEQKAEALFAAKEKFEERQQRKHRRTGEYKQSLESAGIDKGLIDAREVFYQYKEEQKELLHLRKDYESSTDPEEKKNHEIAIQLQVGIIRGYSERLAKLAASCNEESEVS